METRVGESGEDEPIRAGKGWMAAHHGEFLQGVFAEGRSLKRGLLSLPCSLHCSQATFMVTDAKSVTVEPSWKAKAHRAVVLALRELGRPAMGGRLLIRENIPPGRGFGSSTCDVLATMAAVQDAVGASLPTSVVSRLAVEAEQASDSLMLGDRVALFAHREGEVIEEFEGQLSPLEVIGFGTSSDGRGVDTLALPPARYSSWEIEAFRILRAMLRNAVRDVDPELLGRVATVSARLNQRHLPVKGFDRLEELARQAGGVGIQVAHSGDVAGLLFDSEDPNVEGQAEAASQLLTRHGITVQWRFRTDK
ncbi:GHMP family kinase ATP-binding protein [Streptomyces decoyicus]|uniref:GHMP family kinase ATP-binding protein n=1 Tax=Streptomyces decoyicus TaxID=249567 RepID=UPI0033A11126